MRHSYTNTLAGLFAFCLGLHSCSSTSPESTTTGNALVGNNALQRTSRLDWIKSTADFNQEGLSSDSVDARIIRLVQEAVNANQLTADIEIPINTHKLEYLDKRNPFDLADFKNAAGREVLNHYDKALHVYKYGDVYISTLSDTKTDQMNVYYAARSFEILKTRYPEAYKRFFVDTKQFLANEPKYGSWLNKNKLFWIGFNENPLGLASNNHFFITGTPTPARNSTSVNVAAVNIHNTKILGSSTAEGPRPVYGGKTDEENYRLHMREGIIVSIVHEMMHNYIQYAAGVSDQFQKASSLRQHPDGRINYDGQDAEEAAVLNTTYQYFNRKGGLMPAQGAYYYPKVFDAKMNMLRNKNLLVSYASYYTSVVPTETNLRDAFIIPNLF